MSAKKKTTTSKAKHTRSIPKNITSNRQLHTPSRRFLRRLPKQFRPKRPELPGGFRLLWRASAVLKRHWRLFLGIVVVYGVLNVILVRGLAGGTNLPAFKDALNQLFKGQLNKVTTGFTLFAYLLSGAGNSSTPSSGAYQTLLLIIVSLAVIWSLRQVSNGVVPRVRDSFYRGMRPLIPFLLIILVIGLQLIPLAVGGTVYATILSNGIAVGGLEKSLWLLFLLILAAVSLYMICSSIFALYIVTLPDMTPMRALRSARQLVRYRRVSVLAKLLFLPVSLLILAAVIIVPLIIFLTAAAQWVFFGLTMVAVAVVHSYMYGFYRELLNE